MGSHRLQYAIQCLSDSSLQVPWVDTPRFVISLQFLVMSVGHAFSINIYGYHAVVAQYNMFRVVHNWVILNNLRRTKSFLDLPLNICFRILHEYGGVRVTFAHLLLSLFETHKHVVGDDSGLESHLFGSGVLSGKHVDFSLVHSKLADICFQKKNICTLHARVEYLRGAHLFPILAAHYRAAALDSRKIVHSSDFHYSAPVFIRMVINFLRSPQKANICHIHTNSLPNLYHVLANCTDFV
mmetsp:Transcript_3391/g.5306  ORF Transcript_3391/g.5306 Transcript_3391/m.5306 type:complete len:240 (-) Transcript_3391:448-1167(-)